MPVCSRLRMFAGVAGVIAVALTLHVLMLAGVGLAHQQDPTAAGTTDATAMAAVTTPHTLPHAPGSGEHEHAVVGCMAVLAVLGLGMLLTAARRPPGAAGAIRPTARRARRRRRSANTVMPPRPLVAQSVLLRV